MNPAGRTEGTLPIPHAAPWSEMDQWLAAKMLRTPTPRSQSEPTGIGVTAPDPGDDPKDGESSNLLQQWKAANLESARQLLKEQCKKCHQESLIENDDAIMAARDSDAPPLIPNRWLKLGIYRRRRCRPPRDRLPVLSRASLCRRHTRCARSGPERDHDCGDRDLHGMSSPCRNSHTREFAQRHRTRSAVGHCFPMGLRPLHNVSPISRHRKFAVEHRWSSVQS